MFATTNDYVHTDRRRGLCCVGSAAPTTTTASGARGRSAMLAGRGRRDPREEPTGSPCTRTCRSRIDCWSPIENQGTGVQDGRTRRYGGLHDAARSAPSSSWSFRIALAGRVQADQTPGTFGPDRLRSSEPGAMPPGSPHPRLPLGIPVRVEPALRPRRYRPQLRMES
jgi:hypothetical protein